MSAHSQVRVMREGRCHDALWQVWHGLLLLQVVPPVYVRRYIPVEMAVERAEDPSSKGRDLFALKETGHPCRRSSCGDVPAAGTALASFTWSV